MSTQQDKLSTYHRLTREGRWCELEPIKDARIKELRREGFSKIEAQDKAWQELADNNPPLSQKAIDTLKFARMMTRRDFPPDYDDEPDEIPLPDLWYPLMTVFACHAHGERLELCRGYTEHVLRNHLVVDAPTKVSRLLGLLYMTAPIRFLETARARLVAVANRCDWTIERELRSIINDTDRVLGHHEAKTDPVDFDFDTKRQADLILMSLEEAISTASMGTESSMA